MCTGASQPQCTTGFCRGILGKIHLSIQARRCLWSLIVTQPYILKLFIGILRAQGLLEPKNITSSSRSRNLKRSRSSTFKVESSAKVPARSESSHPRKRVKLERQEAIDLTVVKHEDSGPPRLLDPSLRGTVIDLTLDDDQASPLSALHICLRLCTDFFLLSFVLYPLPLFLYTLT